MGKGSEEGNNLKRFVLWMVGALLLAFVLGGIGMQVQVGRADERLTAAEDTLKEHIDLDRSDHDTIIKIEGQVAAARQEAAAAKQKAEENGQKLDAILRAVNSK